MPRDLILALVAGLSNVFCGAIAILVSMPLRDRKIAPNSMYGFRLPSTMRSDDAWYEANAFGGRRMIFWGRIVLVVGVVDFVAILLAPPLWFTIASLFVPLLLVVAAIETVVFARRL